MCESCVNEPARSRVVVYGGKSQVAPPRRNRTSGPLSPYRFEACTQGHSGSWRQALYAYCPFMYRDFMVTVTVYGSVIDSGELLCDGVTDFHELVLDDCEGRTRHTTTSARARVGRVLNDA